MRPENINILEENIGSKISGIAYSNFLSDMFPLARETKEKINKWDYIKWKSFCSGTESISKIKRQPMQWENVFADTSDKGLISKIYKVLTKLNSKKNQTTQLKNGQRTWIDTSPKMTYKCPIDLWKDSLCH